MTIPAVVYLSSRQTRLSSSAHVSKLPVSLQKPKQAFGEPPAEEPLIIQVWPFLGKVDDLVVIKGKNFGQNPQLRQLRFGAIKAVEEDINWWVPDQIEATVPESAISGPVILRAGKWQITTDYPFTVYDKNTKTRIKKQAGRLTVSQAGNLSSAKIWLIGEKEPLELKELKPAEEIFLADIGEKEILSIGLYDEKGNLIPFYVEPSEFGF
jgi:hypothetical protein